MQKFIIQIPFQGFYETSFSAMIDYAEESFFHYDDQGNSAIPDQLYFNMNYKHIELKIARAYMDKFEIAYEEMTNIKLNLTFESMQSPKEYNFETDRLFAYISASKIKKLFAASKKNKHEELKAMIDSRCSSCSGFISFYSNQLETWLEKPVLEWDHNELKILLEAVLNIDNAQQAINNNFDPYYMLEDLSGNGYLDNWLCEAMPRSFIDFADLQREHGKALDYDVFIETGAAYDPDSNEPMPPLRCKQTIELPL